MKNLRIIICGAKGRMGREIIRLVKDKDGLSLVACVDKDGGDDIYQTLSDFDGQADVLIDFSSHLAIGEIMAYCESRKLPAVIAATGHTPEEMKLIVGSAEKIPVFKSANMSIGVALLARLVKQTTAVFKGCDIEIIEKHHNKKIDSPSGTALLLADAVKSERDGVSYVYGRNSVHKRTPDEVGIHSLRMGNVVGEHEVIFSTDTQSITLKHEAHDRALFAEGAVVAAEFLVGKPNGLYDMKDLLEE